MTAQPITPPIIDVHSHAVVDFGDGMDAGTNLPMGLIPPWSPAGALALMDDAGIATSILSMPEAGTHFDDATNAERARRMNECLAGVVAEAPNRRGALATLPLTSIDASLRELAYALDVLHLDGVTLPTSVRDVYLGDPRFDPLFAELERRDVTVFTHPVLAPASAALTIGLNQAVLEFMFDTTRMMTSMIVGGTVRRFPRLRLIVSHGGGAFPYLLTRLQTLLPVVGPGPDREPVTAQDILEGAGYFYYDLTAATSTAHLTALAQVAPPSRLVMGFDIPYLRPQTMRPAIEAVRGWAPFADEDLEAIFHGTAASLFPTLEARRLAA
jgi:predicted TIM-barrel fold metal-dependent hydrolase